MRNEGPFILEWIAYHRAIGVDDFLIYSNDCTDGTDRLLDALQQRGIVTHRQNPFRGTSLKPQHAALKAAEEEEVVTRAGWVISMDVDEFLNIHTGDGSLAALYEAVGDATMISATWRLFGNGDIDRFDPDLTIRQFTRCAPQFVRKPHHAWGFKTLSRSLGHYRKLGVHRPRGLKPEFWDQIRWVNGSGRPMPREALRNAWRSTASTFGYDLVTLNHYAVRNSESFLVKRDRGRVNHVDRDQGMNYWFRMNHNTDEDRSIHRMIPAVEAELAALLADPELARLHTDCIAAHRTRIEELRARPDMAAFYAQITSERMQRLSRLHPHFGANVYHAGPEVIPDEIITADLSPNYFFTVPRQD
ncbi:MAG: glycosyltransferase family 2 protein [Rhodobacteraceae bacterium]|nr:glycosyltransferase family 2 protein [Paracoccaceae bacterium]